MARKNRRKRRADAVVFLVLAGFAGWIIASYVVPLFTAGPSYEVIEQADGYEIRRYDEFTVIQIELEGVFDQARSEANGVFAKYRAGANLKYPVVITTIRGETTEESTRLPRTAPMLIEQEPGTFTFSYILPGEYDADTAPRPTDPRLRIRTIPARYVAAISSSGGVAPGRMANMQETLRRRLERDVRPTLYLASFMSAAYDAGWLFPLFRRYEIQVPVRN